MESLVVALGLLILVVIALSVVLTEKNKNRNPLREKVQSGDADVDSAAGFMLEMKRHEEIEKMRQSYDDRVETAELVDAGEFCLETSVDFHTRPVYNQADDFLLRPSWGHLAAVKEGTDVFEDWTISEMHSAMRTGFYRSNSVRFLKRDVSIEEESVEVEYGWDPEYDERPKYVTMRELAMDSWNSFLKEFGKGELEYEKLEKYQNSDDWFVSRHELLEYRTVSLEPFEMEVTFDAFFGRYVKDEEKEKFEL